MREKGGQQFGRCADGNAIAQCRHSAANCEDSRLAFRNALARERVEVDKPAKMYVDSGLPPAERIDDLVVLLAFVKHVI